MVFRAELLHAPRGFRPEQQRAGDRQRYQAYTDQNSVLCHGIAPFHALTHSHPEGTRITRLPSKPAMRT